MLNRYEAVLSALQAGVVIHAADTQIIEANERARTLLGLQDLEGRIATDPLWVFLEADHSPMALERFPVMQAITTLQPVRDLIAIIRPPYGPDVCLEVNALPVVNDVGQLEQVVVTFIDITDRRRAEEMLSDEAERLALVLAASQLGLWDWNLITGEAWFDERWAQIQGYRLDELEPVSGQTWLHLSHPDDVADAGATINAHGRGTNEFYDIEFRMRHKDGHWVWVHDRGRVVEWTDDARPLRMTGTHEDVSAAHAAAEVLAAAEEESRAVFDRSRVATCLVANDGRIVRVNPAICDLLGRSEAELLTLTFLDVTHPDDRTLGAEMIQELVSGQRSSLRVTKRYVTGSGRVIWGDVTVSSVVDAHGAVQHRIAQILDVTTERTLRDSLTEAERIAHVGAWQLDVATGRVEWSQELRAMFGLESSEPVPDFEDQRQLFTRESWKRVSAAVDRAISFGEPYVLDLEFVRRDGKHGWMEARGEAIKDAHGVSVEVHGISLDITARKLASEEFRALATHDSLTGLPNRAALLEEITRALRAAKRTGRATAVLMMDLDRFKDVNDTLGHASGDDLLVASADRLQQVVRAGDLVARLGGDEFVIVMRDLDDPAEAMGAASRIVHEFQKPFTLDARELFATASVGVAIAADGTQAGDLVREADTAMYAAKSAGRDRVSMFNEDLRTAVTARLEIEADLRRALERGQLAVWYQPEVDLRTGAVIALEALLRWHHPDGNVWTAEKFVDVAEDTGLIIAIGEWVLMEACNHGAAWAAEQHGRPPVVRVNVSAVQLAEPGLLQAIDDALGVSGLDPAHLCVEITETTLLRQTSTTTANLAGIHDRGISLALDDFGTGYASLTYLHQYPVDVIKIDRSFITDPTLPDHDHRMVAGIIALAALLDITVTAEGVIHPTQAEHLRAMGCPSAQGWLYSAAVPPEAVAELLTHVYPHG